jgi:hypothetical protein
MLQNKRVRGESTAAGASAHVPPAPPPGGPAGAASDVSPFSAYLKSLKFRSPHGREPGWNGGALFVPGDIVEALWDGIANNSGEWFTGTISGRRKGLNNLGWFYDINYIDGDVQYDCREKRIRACTEAVHRREVLMYQKKVAAQEKKDKKSCGAKIAVVLVKTEGVTPPPTPGSSILSTRTEPTTTSSSRSSTRITRSRSHASMLPSPEDLMSPPALMRGGLRMKKRKRESHC